MPEGRQTSGTSGWPLLIGVGGAVIAAVIASVAELGADRLWAQSARLVGIPAVGLTSALIALLFALRLTPGRGRRLWTLIGIGTAFLALAAAASAPGVPVTRAAEVPLAALRALTYVIVAGAALSAAYHYRQQVDMVWPVVESFVATSAIALVVWFSVMRVVTVAPGDLSFGVWFDEVALIGDLAFILGPTLLLGLALIRVPERLDTAPWLLFGAAISATVLGEVGWFLETGTGFGRGALADFAWMLGMVGIAASAGLAWDADRAGRLLA